MIVDLFACHCSSGLPCHVPINDKHTFPSLQSVNSRDQMIRVKIRIEPNFAICGGDELHSRGYRGIIFWWKYIEFEKSAIVRCSLRTGDKCLYPIWTVGSVAHENAGGKRRCHCTQLFGQSDCSTGIDGF